MAVVERFVDTDLKWLELDKESDVKKALFKAVEGNSKWVAVREIIEPAKLEQETMRQVLKGELLIDVVIQQAVRPGKYAVVEGAEVVVSAKVLGLPTVWATVVSGVAQVYHPKIEHLIGIQKAKDEAKKFLYRVPQKLMPLVKIANRLGKAEFLALTKGQKSREEEQVLAFAEQKEKNRVQTWNKLYQSGRKEGLSAGAAKDAADKSFEYRREQLTAEAALVAARTLEMKWVEEREAITDLLAMPQVEPMLLWEQARSIPVYKSEELRAVLEKRAKEYGVPLRKGWGLEAREAAIEARRAKAKDKERAVERGPATDVPVEEGTISAAVRDLKAANKVREADKAVERLKQQVLKEKQVAKLEAAPRPVSRDILLSGSPKGPASQLGNSHASEVYKLELTNGETVVYKPSVAGVNPGEVGEDLERSKKIMGFEGEGTGAAREVVSSRIADLVDMGSMVPTATIRDDLSRGRGSVAQFLPGAMTAVDYQDAVKYKPELFNEKLDQSQLAKGILFDAMLSQQDRHEGNWMVSKKADGGLNVHLIDNMMSLPAGQQQSSTGLVRFAAGGYPSPMRDEEIPPALKNVWITNKDVVMKAARESGINEDAVLGLGVRINALKREGIKWREVVRW